RPLRDPLSFPTRRSSDLCSPRRCRRRTSPPPFSPPENPGRIREAARREERAAPPPLRVSFFSFADGFYPPGRNSRCVSRASRLRSEEHTSELQSPCNLVC